MTHKFGQVLAAEDVAAVSTPSAPWIEPTEIVAVPSDAEMADWMPDPDPAHRTFRWEQNVTTGERKAIELTLDEYKARHVAKIVSKNEYVVRKQAERKAAARKALMDALVDKLESDPTLLDRLAKA